MDVVILTGTELRHRFMRMALGSAENINVVYSFCETAEGTALDQAHESGSQIQIDHLRRRARVEEDFFGSFVRFADDHSNPHEIPRGEINDQQHYETIQALDPDIIIAYGCSIIEDPLLSAYEGRFLNLHLGLSPYYRGTGTNFWPLVNDEPEYVGATFMYMDEGVDTGNIIHQLRVQVYEGDGPHQIGNRVIADSARAYASIIRRFDQLESVEHPTPSDRVERYYRSADFSDDATRKLYQNFEEGMIEKYLSESSSLTSAVPILKNPALVEK